jgi:hypothetical protein
MMNKKQLIAEMNRVTEFYVENPLLVESTEEERGETLSLIHETLSTRHKDDPETLLKEYRSATMILEANETYSKNMAQLEDVMSDLLSLKSYFAPHASKLPELTQGIDRALAKMQEAENEITQRTNGLLGGIKGSYATRNEVIDRELSPLDMFLMELTTTAAEVPHYGSPSGPGWRTLADYVTPAPSHVAHHAARAGGTMLSNDELNATLAAKVKDGIGANAMGPGGSDILGSKAAATMSQMKGGVAGAKMGAIPPDGGTGILSSITQSGQSIWAKLGTIFSKAGFMSLLKVGIPLAAVYGLYRWLKQRTVILNKIINFTMALAAILKSLHRQSRILATETDKSKKVGEIASLSMDGAIRSSAGRTKGVFAGFTKLFQNTKPEDFAQFMSVANVTQQVKELTVDDYLKIFSDPKMVSAFGTSQIADLQQAKSALRALDSQVAAAVPAPVAAPGAPVVAPVVPGAPVAAPPVATTIDPRLAQAITNSFAPPQAAKITSLVTRLDAAPSSEGSALLVSELEAEAAAQPTIVNDIARMLTVKCVKIRALGPKSIPNKARRLLASGLTPIKAAHALRIAEETLPADPHEEFSSWQIELDSKLTGAGFPVKTSELIFAPRRPISEAIAKEIRAHKRISAEFKTLSLLK